MTARVPARRLSAVLTRLVLVLTALAALSGLGLDPAPAHAAHQPVTAATAFAGSASCPGQHLPAECMLSGKAAQASVPQSSRFAVAAPLLPVAITSFAAEAPFADEAAPARVRAPLAVSGRLRH